MLSFKNYLKETSPKVKKFGLWLKGLIGLLAGSAYIQQDVKMAFYSLIGGALITGALELLPPDDDDKGTGTPPGGSMAIATLLLFFGLAFSGCSIIKPEVDRTKTDTTITTYKQVDISVKGAKVSAGLNLDSLYRAALFAKDQRADDSIARLNIELKYKRDSIAALKANKPVPVKPAYVPTAPAIQYVTDPQTKAQLSYYIDQYGKLQLGCQAKDQVVATLQAQVTKLTTDKTVTTDVVTQTPVWNKVVMIVEGILLLICAIILVIKLIL
jgi:hypothetical protein